jgi:DNA-binding HxlR family transcriptional regulator
MKKEILRKLERYGDNCPVNDVLNHIGDKWSMLMVIMLSDHSTLRFNELHQLIDGFSKKCWKLTGS